MTSPVAPELPVAPALFDVLIQYAKDIGQGKVEPTPSMGATSPALTFCENFFVQFFQNQMKQPIVRINFEAKKISVGLRRESREKNGPPVLRNLLASFEKLCEEYPNILALGYGVAGKAMFFYFHNDYLLTLLKRTVAWAQEEKYVEIEEKANLSLLELQRALQLIPR